MIDAPLTSLPRGEQVAEPFRLPPLVEASASLSPVEKSLLGHFLLLTQPRLVVEVGVYRAVTTRFLIDALALNAMTARVVGFDLPEVVVQLRTGHPDVARWEREGRLELVGGELPESLRDWAARTTPQIDLALVDARHDFPSVMWELRLLWPHLAPHGVILGHDYTAEFDGVRYAFDHFARRHGAMLLPLTGQSDSATTRSTLIALRRPLYTKTLRSWLHHRWQGAKADFVRSPWTGALWRKVLRPLLRAGKKT
jgi:predicted O-methyltransferase YrrM